MTLLIAKIEDDTIKVLADTQLTYASKLGKKPIDGLKLFFLDKHTAMGFSGSPDDALNIVKAIHHIGIPQSLDSLYKDIDLLKNLGKLDADFIFMKAGPNPKIIKIHDSGVSDDNLRFAWVGSKEAAEFVVDNVNENMMNIEQKFRSALINRKFCDVGGWVTSAIGKKNGFKFVPYMSLTSPRYIPKNNQWQTVDFGTAANGGFGYTTVTPKNPGVNGWGIYFFQGYYGFFYNFQQNGEVVEKLVAKNVTLDSFIEAVEKDTNIELEYCGKLG